jgi:predicted AAA+ superfamily ATPase
VIDRHHEIKELISLLKRYRVVGIVGARQVGKTTLARSLLDHVGGSYFYYDLENPEDLARLADPMFALKGARGSPEGISALPGSRECFS